MKAKRPWAILLVLCTGTFAVLLDTTIVNTALPSLITSLHASLDQALWVVNGYLLVFCALLILASRLGDMFGRRRMFVVGLALFALSSALCGAAQNPGELIAARVLQGLGAAALAPQPMVIIQDVFPRERMGAAFGVFSSMVGLAAVSGPVLGGVLTTYLSWRWVFYVNLPIALAGIVLTLRLVPEDRGSHRHSLDLPGVLLSTVGLSAVVYGLIEGQRYDWGTVGGGINIAEIIAAGCALLVAFVLWERRLGGSPGADDRAHQDEPLAHRGEPLVPLALFRDRTFSIMVVLNVVVQFALQSMLLVNSINLQSVLGFTAVHAGLTGLPLTIALTALAPFAGRLTDRFGGKFVLMTGLVVYGAGILGVAAVASVTATSLSYAPVLLVAGLGMGAIFAPLATIALRAAPPPLVGAASGVLNSGRQFGATLGGAVTGAVLAAQLASAMHSRALAAAGALPASARPGFVAGFASATKGGLQVGRNQQAAPIPHGTPAAFVPELRHLVAVVFDDGYIAAMRPTLAVSIVALLAGAALCLLLPRGTSRSLTPPAAATDHGGTRRAEQASRSLTSATASHRPQWPRAASVSELRAARLRGAFRPSRPGESVTASNHRTERGVWGASPPKEALSHLRVVIRHRSDGSLPRDATGIDDGRRIRRAGRRTGLAGRAFRGGPTPAAGDGLPDARLA